MRWFELRNFLIVSMTFTVIMMTSRAVFDIICQRHKFCPNVGNAITFKGLSAMFVDTFYHRRRNTCRPFSKDIVGKIKVSVVGADSWPEIERRSPNVSECGQFQPKHCRARQKVAILVPFKDRESHLKSFTNHMHPFLQGQNLDYRIYVINQVHPEKFNRAKLFNVGFVEALKDYNWDCFIFHDVDLLPEDDRNLYTCSKLPKHMSVAVSKLNYQLMYPELFGGVVALTRQHMLKLNGFSNQFWGWGGEDDDMFNQIQLNNMTIVRISNALARYTALPHVQAQRNPAARKLVTESSKKKRMHEGLTTLKYHLVNIECSKLYTNISANLDS